MGALFTKLFQFLIDLLRNFGFILYNLFIDLLNGVITAIALLFQGILSFFPSVTFPLQAPAGLVELSGKIAWFVPVSTIASCLLILGGCYVTYFTVRPILKFVHLA